MSTQPADLPARLKAWRIAYGLSQTQAARRLGIPYQTLTQWESGRRTPSRSGLALIERELGSKPQ